MKEIRDSAAAREAEESASAYRAAFGIRPDRSAEDRAYRDSLATRNLTHSEAGALFAQAQARGDSVAQTALAEYAWGQRNNELDGHAWIPLLESYAGSSAVFGKALSTLVGIEQPSKLERLQQKMSMEVAVPSDMHGDLNYLARDDEPSGDRPIGMPWAG